MYYVAGASWPAMYNVVVLAAILTSDAIFRVSIQCATWFGHYLYLVNLPWPFVDCFCRTVYPDAIFAKIVTVSHVVLNMGYHVYNRVSKRLFGTITTPAAPTASTMVGDLCCRVCLDTCVETASRRIETETDFMTPCRCTGSIKYIHPECLKQSRAKSQRGDRQCMTCNYVYEYEVIQTFCIPWLDDLSDRITSDAAIDRFVFGVFIVYGMMVGALFIAIVDDAFHRPVCRAIFSPFTCSDRGVLNVLFIYSPAYLYSICMSHGLRMVWRNMRVAHRCIAFYVYLIFPIVTLFIVYTGYVEWSWVMYALSCIILIVVGFKRVIDVIVAIFVFTVVALFVDCIVWSWVMYTLSYIILFAVGFKLVVSAIVSALMVHGSRLVKTVYMQHYSREYKQVKNISPNVQSTNTPVE